MYTSHSDKRISRIYEVTQASTTIESIAEESQIQTETNFFYRLNGKLNLLKYVPVITNATCPK